LNNILLLHFLNVVVLIITILPEDSQYTYAVSMEKENCYLLELYFTAAMDDGTYFLVTCCYNPIDTASRYATQTAVFSMETQ